MNVPHALGAFCRSKNAVCARTSNAVGSKRESSRRPKGSQTEVRSLRWLAYLKIKKWGVLT